MGTAQGKLLREVKYAKAELLDLHNEYERGLDKVVYATDALDDVVSRSKTFLNLVKRHVEGSAAERAILETRVQTSCPFTDPTLASTLQILAEDLAQIEQKCIHLAEKLPPMLRTAVWTNTKAAVFGAFKSMLAWVAKGCALSTIGFAIAGLANPAAFAGAAISAAGAVASQTLSAKCLGKEVCFSTEAAKASAGVRKAMELLGDLQKSSSGIDTLLININSSLQNNLQEVMSVHTAWQKRLNTSHDEDFLWDSAFADGSNADEDFLNKITELRDAMDTLKEELFKIRKEVKAARDLVHNARKVL